MCICIYTSVNKYICIYIYTCVYIYIYIYTTMRKKADKTCNGQAQVERPVTKSYDDMKQWDSSEDTTTRLSITLQLKVGSMGREAGNMTWTSFYCRSFPAVPPHKAEITCHKKPRHARPRYYCLPELERFWAKHVQWLLKAQSYAAELNDCSKPYSMHTNTSTRTCVCAPMYIYVYIYIYICVHVICYVLHLKIVHAKIHDNRLDETVASCMCWTMHCLSRQKRGLG